MQNRSFFCSALLLVLLAFSASVTASEQYRVIKVESWDTLNMRSGPGTKNGVISKLPHDATGVSLAGGAKKVGRTQWVEVNWQGKSGWVSKAYLEKQAATDNATANTAVDMQEQDAAKKSSPEPENTDHIVKNKKSGMWILECGNSSPFWKVEILPEWMRGTLGTHKTGMPITRKRQKHGKYHNVAVETEVRGRNKWNRLRLTLTYNKSCYSTLNKRKVAFSVEGLFNNEPVSGCCRSYQVR
ncbi:MAG: SH3 domain-containing protein [Thiolinea sp.]